MRDRGEARKNKKARERLSVKTMFIDDKNNGCSENYNVCPVNNDYTESRIK